MKIVYLSLERNIDLEAHHEILYIDFRTENAQELIRFFKPDFLIEREFNDGLSKYVDILNFVSKEFPLCKKAVWLIDSHCNLDWHKKYSVYFDYVFLAISKFVPIFKRINKNVFFLPLFFPYRVDYIKEPKEYRKNRIVFVGSQRDIFKNRNMYIKDLKTEFNDFFFPTTDYENMEDIISSSVASFNCSLDQDMNFRIFESIGLGTQVITDDVNDIHKISGLKDRIHIYKNKYDLIKICYEVLKGQTNIDVFDNQRWIKENHCLIHRHLDMIDMIQSGIQKTW